MDEQGAGGEAAEIHILFGSRRDAERRIAGVRALARIVRVFEEAGLVSVSVVLGEEGELWAAVVEDLARVAPGVRVQLLHAAGAAPAPSAGEVLAFSGEHLVAVGAVRRFLAGHEPCLIWRGRPIARRIAGGMLPRSPKQLLTFAGEADNLDDDEVVPLASPLAATRALLCRSGKASDGPVSRWLNRPISRPISAICLAIPWLRPNHVTFVTAVIAIVMFGCFLFGGPVAILVGGILFHVASVVDGVDGEMARVSFRSSMSGAMFDIIVDRLTILAFFLGITIAMARTEGWYHALVGGWGFAAAAIGVLILARVLRRIEPPRSYWVMEKVVRRRFPAPPLKWIVDFLATCIRRDVFSFVFPLMMVLGAPWSVTWVFTGFTTLWLAVVLGTTPSILRGSVQPHGQPAAGEAAAAGEGAAAAKASKAA
jgi:CDP-L-myo-inositol myo-inositolphosphotransferase